MKKTIRKALFISISFILFTFLAFRYLTSRPGFSIFQSPVTSLVTSEKQVALTFDDGPSDTLTPPLLDLLQEHNIKATFFVNGNRLEKFPEVGKRIVREGHLLGNHTYKHDRMIWTSREVIKQDLLKTDRLIQSCGQNDVSLFRPPYGDKFINLSAVVQDLKKVMVTWSVDPKAQYKPEYEVDKIISQTLKQISNGSIILLHDGWAASKEEFLNIVEQIIDTLKARGYSFSFIQKSNHE